MFSGKLAFIGPFILPSVFSLDRGRGRSRGFVSSFRSDSR